MKLNIARTLVVAVLSLSTSQVWAAPGELSTIPLFLGRDVKPNVLFVLDDSGSMENEVLVREGGVNSPKDGTGATSGNLDMTPSFDDEGEFLEHCVGYNVIAFDPSRTYVPWVGFNDVDISGANPQAPSFPTGLDHNDNGGTAYQGSSGNNGGDVPLGGATLDLTTPGFNGPPPGYVRWNDADNDNEFDAGECNADPLSDADSSATLETLEALGFVAFDRMSVAMKQNYANWYTYYRKRRFLLVASMLGVAANADIRAGIATINNDSQVGFEVVDLAEETAGVDNRLLMRDRLLRMGRPAGTPLRRPLENAGRYFEGVALNGGVNFVSASNNPPSPILPPEEGGACQQNYTMLMTDGLSNENLLTPSSTIGNADGDGNSLYDRGVYGDIYSDTLGDIAMHFYERDLRPNDALYPDIVRSNRTREAIGGDPGVFDANGELINPAQNMLTYTVAFGVTGSIFNVETSIGQGVLAPNAIPWPVADDADFWSSQAEESIDDLLHAAYNGRGDFLSAVDPLALENGIEDIVGSILSANRGAAAASGFNSTNVSEDTVLYQATFFPSTWSGTVQAIPLAEDGSISSTIDFDTGALLAARVAEDGHTDRQIITYNGTNGIPFAFPVDATRPSETELSVSQINDLLADANGQDLQVYGANIVAFLRGDSSLADGVQFRNRGINETDPNSNPNVLGDIANSSPQFVAIPGEEFPESIAPQSYQAFVTANLNRTPALYVGGNDGMVHGFNADNGEELFAYIPQFLFSDQDNQGLHYLADPNYSHLPYIDATPTVGDAFVNNQWRTFLVGGAGRGGRGIYVLDVTNPNALTEGNANNIVKQEFTHEDLGFTFSRPQIAKMNNGKWAAIFGNGYTEETGSGSAQLFILFLDGTGFEVIDTGVGQRANGTTCFDNNSDCNGLSSPTLIDLNQDSVVDRVYAGDLHGNMWAFDLSSQNENEWSIAHNNASSNPEPLFQACTSTPCAVSDRQPITTEPVVTGHTTELSSITAPNAFVMFGTGQLLTEDDVESTADQTFYGVWDAGPDNGGLTRNLLTEQEILINSEGQRTLSDNTVNYATTASGTAPNYGWFIELPDTGERSIITPIAVGEIVLFTTSIPTSDPCGDGGSGFLMAAEIFDGSVAPFNVFGNANQAGVLIDNLPVGLSFVDGDSIITDSTGGIPVFDTNVTSDTASRRFNWLIVR